MMLSRVADSVFWVGRYLERADNTARFAEVNHHLAIDLPDAAPEQWEPLVAVMGDLAWFHAHYDGPIRENVLRFLTLDEAYPNSILSCVRALRENARSVREVLILEVWEEINRLYWTLSRRQGQMPPMEDTPAFMSRIREACHLISGYMSDTVSRTTAWQFFQLGRFLERADKTSRLLDVKYFMLLPSAGDVGSPYDTLQWAAVLRSASAYQMYRKSKGRIEPERVVEYLLFDPMFPRSVRFCLTQVVELLHRISNTALSGYSNPAERLAGLLQSRFTYTTVGEVLLSGMHEFLDSLQADLNAVGSAIFDTYFAIQPAAGGPDGPSGQ